MVGVDGNEIAVILNQELYAQIRPDLRDAVWNQAFSNAETLARDGYRDDLAVRREARQLVESQMEQATCVERVAAMPCLSIALASNTSVRASGDK